MKKKAKKARSKHEYAAGYKGDGDCLFALSKDENFPWRHIPKLTLFQAGQAARKLPSPGAVIYRLVPVAIRKKQGEKPVAIKESTNG
jgi:hypothetical protein